MTRTLPAGTRSSPGHVSRSVSRPGRSPETICRASRCTSARWPARSANVSPNQRRVRAPDGPREASSGLEARRQRLALHRIRYRILQRARRPPLGARTHVAVRADLVDIPVDLEVVAVRVGELDRDLAASAAAALENDGHAVLAEPGAGAKHLVERAHLEREVIEAPARCLGDLAVALRSLPAAHQRNAVMIAVDTHEHHAAGHHAVRVTVGHAQAEQVLVEAQGSIEIANVQHDVSDLSELELHTRSPF